ncbi:hypothetical protein PR048_000804 [Dryococelus australis]|uniref:Uncharacterized protein n=1 Tax=Dryococelus australis TaxID=614101 RepID=A0ABQ9IFR7_9NEOP|nr:hypothetical protein PR048_000804 [Dryococelus australis]
MSQRHPIPKVEGGSRPDRHNRHALCTFLCEKPLRLRLTFLRGPPDAGWLLWDVEQGGVGVDAVAPGFSQMEIVPDDAAGPVGFLGDVPSPSPFHSSADAYSSHFSTFDSQDFDADTCTYRGFAIGRAQQNPASQTASPSNRRIVPTLACLVRSPITDAPWAPARSRYAVIPSAGISAGRAQEWKRGVGGGWMSSSPCAGRGWLEAVRGRVTSGAVGCVFEPWRQRTPLAGLFPPRSSPTLREMRQGLKYDCTWHLAVDVWIEKWHLAENRQWHIAEDQGRPSSLMTSTLKFTSNRHVLHALPFHASILFQECSNSCSVILLRWRPLRNLIWRITSGSILVSNMAAVMQSMMADGGQGQKSKASPLVLYQAMQGYARTLSVLERLITASSIMADIRRKVVYRVDRQIAGWHRLVSISVPVSDELGLSGMYSNREFQIKMPGNRGGITPGFSHVGIRFSRESPVSPALSFQRLLNDHLTSLSSTLKISMLTGLPTKPAVANFKWGINNWCNEKEFRLTLIPYLKFATADLVGRPVKEPDKSLHSVASVRR